MALRAGIIGAGGIAWRYDGGAWDGKAPSITLASCLHRHPDTSLVAVLEPVADARKNFDDGYLGPRPITVYDNIEQFLAQGLDLVAIASPSQFHASHIEACLNASVPRLWIEKPVTLELEDFNRLLKRYRKMDTPPRTCVNFLRRCLPQLTYMKQYLDTSPNLPDAISIAVTYSRQLDVNGIHMLDLLGALTDAKYVPPLDFIRTADGANPQFGLTLNGHPVTVTGHDLSYHLIEMSITDSQGRLSLVRGAQDLVWEGMEPNPEYPGFFRTGQPQQVEGFDGASASLNEAAYSMLCALIEDSEPSPSTLESAWFSQALLDRVQRECKATA